MNNIDTRPLVISRIKNVLMVLIQFFTIKEKTSYKKELKSTSIFIVYFKFCIIFYDSRCLFSVFSFMSYTPFSLLQTLRPVPWVSFGTTLFFSFLSFTPPSFGTSRSFFLVPLVSPTCPHSFPFVAHPLFQTIHFATSVPYPLSESQLGFLKLETGFFLPFWWRTETRLVIVWTEF